MSSDAVVVGDLAEVDVRRLRGLGRRALGRVSAAAILVLLVPLMLLIALSIKITSRGPVFFRQERLGLQRRRFTMLKFRTMHHLADDGVHREYVRGLLRGEISDGGVTGVFKLANDPRLTRVGPVLRRLSLDELPQLINVVLGHMALVGPRPVLSYESDLFPAWSAARFSVRPGITGLWQVSGRSATDYLSALRLDVEYVRRRSVWIDLHILLRTVKVLFGRSVAR